MKKSRYILLLLSLVIACIPFLPLTSYATDNATVVSDFSVENSIIELHSENTVKFHVKAPEDKLIVNISCPLCTNNGVNKVDKFDAITSREPSVFYDKGTCETDVTIHVTPENYGIWMIEEIQIDFADGSSEVFYNKCKRANGIDMSGSDFSIANDPGDTTGPTISGPYTIESKTVQQDEYIKISFNVKDSNGIAMVRLVTSNNELLCLYDSSNFANIADDGTCTFEFAPHDVGSFQIVYILALDTSLNTTKVQNIKCKGDHGEVTRKEDLSCLDYIVSSKPESDSEKNAPIIRVDTIRVKHYRVGFMEENEISFAVDDESEVSTVYVMYLVSTKSNMSFASSNGVYDPATDRYVCKIPPCSYFGEWKPDRIYAEDIYGNGGLATDINIAKQSGGYDFDTSTTQWCDLSIGKFYCGLSDDDSGVFVTGNGMDENATLHVNIIGEEDPEHDELTDAMLEKHYNEDSLYKIEMEGAYNKNGNKVNVSFPVDELSNGDRVRIRHLQDNGTIQTEDSVVTGGRADIDVSSFSPFLIEVPDFKDIYKAKIEGISNAVNYTGKRYTPELKVFYEGSELVKDRDYTISYGDNKNAGPGNVTISGIGDYGYSKTVYIDIAPKGTTLKKVSKGKKSFSVKWKKQSAKMSKVRITGYQIQYSTSSDFSSDNTTKNVKGYKKTSCKISKLKAKTRYYVRIRTYITVGGKNYFSGWSKVKAVKTK